MKCVNETTEQQRLVAARDGSIEEQKAYLEALLDSNSNVYIYDVVLYMMMNDDDLKWLKPLALEPFLPAVCITTVGMWVKRSITEEEFFDEESQESVILLRGDIVENETVFTPDKELLDNNEKVILSQLETIDSNILSHLPIIDYPHNDKIENELCRRGDRYALIRRGDLYRRGDEEKGIFINYYTAKSYYDRAGKDFDPKEAERENFKEAMESDPIFATFHIEGPSVPAVKDLLHKIFGNYRESSKRPMHLPIRLVMKAIVDSDAYVGYIQEIDEDERLPYAIELETEFYGCYPECLQYALKKAFRDLKIDFIEHGE